MGGSTTPPSPLPATEPPVEAFVAAPCNLYEFQISSALNMKKKPSENSRSADAVKQFEWIISAVAGRLPLSPVYKDSASTERKKLIYYIYS